MRIVLTSWGSYGDLFPYLGIARRLKALGHAPVLAACPIHRDVVENAGVPFHPLRPDIDPQATDLIRRVMDRRIGSEVVIRELIIPGLRDAFADMQQAARGADVIVTHPVTMAAPVFAEKSGIRWLSTVLAPLSFFSVYDFPVLAPLTGLGSWKSPGPWMGRLMKRVAKSMTKGWTAPVRALRAEHGLPPAADALYEGQFSPYGTLALFSRVLAAPQPDWPPHTKVTGFVHFNASAAVPPRLAEFLEQGEPPIVFTLGSSAVGAAGNFYQESAKAAAMLGRRAVLLTGPYPQNQPRLALSPGVIAVEYAPHDAVFPRASSVVHHGGIGTTGQILRAGCPMLVVPFAHDQPDNAHRVQSLGVARVLYPARYTAVRVAGHLRALLERPAYRSQAESVGARVREENGTAAACDAILSF